MRDWGQDLLRACIGKRLERIARVLDARGDSAGESGPLELTFEGGRVVHLTRDPRSEFLSVREGPWEDRADDRRVRIDVSDRPGYAEVLNDHVFLGEGAVTAIPEPMLAEGAQPPAAHKAMGAASLFGSTWLVNPEGCVAGVELPFFGATITFAIREGGEYVVFGRAGALPREWGLRRWPDMTMEA